MIDERTEEEASLYALGALSEAEAARFEAVIAEDPELRTLVDELREVSASFAYLAASRVPPEHVRTQLLASIRGDKAHISLPGSRFSWVPWALAAGFAITAGFLAWDRGEMQHELVTLRSQDALSKLRIATLSSKLEGYTESAGTVAWDATNQRGVLTLEKLPPAGPAQDYQLWVIDPQYKQPVSGGIVRVDEKGNARLTFTIDVPIKTADKFAVSREPRGGSEAPEGPIVILGQ